jgi:hypothetical protein
MTYLKDKLKSISMRFKTSPEGYNAETDLAEPVPKPKGGRKNNCAAALVAQAFSLTLSLCHPTHLGAPLAFSKRVEMNLDPAG